jgi:hypothetical protein
MRGLVSLADGYQRLGEASTLKMEAADSSEMLVPIYRDTRCHMSVDCNSDTRRRKNFKTYERWNSLRAARDENAGRKAKPG